MIGKADIEDALKRLDKLTNEEVRMAVAVGIDGAQPFSISFREIYLTLMFPEGRETKVVIQQVADSMDQVKR